MKLNADEIKKLAKMTLATKPESMSCEDWMHLVGEYVECAHRGDAPSDELLAVKQHAEDCPECMDELEALQDLLDEDES